MPRLTARPGVARERGARPDADRHDDEIGRKLGSVVEQHAAHARRARARVCPEDRLGVGLGVDLRRRAPRSPPSSRKPDGGSSWRSISVGMRWTTLTSMPCSLRPMAASRPSRPPPITTALAAGLRREQHGVDVVEVAIGEDAGELRSRHGNDDRRRAGGDDQLVVRRDDAMLGGHRRGVAVDGDDAVALIERHAVVDVPAVAVDDDLIEGLLARQDRREHDAVVVDARLGVEDRDLVGFRARLRTAFPARGPATCRCR